MMPHYKNIHNRFKINGFHLDKEALFQLAYSYIKEGVQFEKEFGEFLLDWIDNKDTIELMTSGTTGIPKLITLQKQAMVNSAIATADFFNLRPGDKVLHCLPTRYIAGKMMFVRSIIVGLEMDLIAPTSHLDDLLPSKKYDFVALVPIQAQAGLDKLNQFKKIIIGGAKLTDTLAHQLKSCNAEIYETYGMTETITHIAAKPIGEKAFSVLPNIKIAKDDRDCLVIDAPHVSNKVIVTNDLIELVGENQFVFFGRIDNIINSGGVKLIPEKIEEKLATKIHSRFFVAGVKDADLGEKLVLIIEGENQTFEDTIFDGLDKYEKPKEVFFVAKFTETENGKIKRKEILESI